MDIKNKADLNLKNIQFLEDMRKLSSSLNNQSKLISMKIPENLLRTFKAKCEAKDLKYQTQIKKLMLEWLSKS